MGLFAPIPPPLVISGRLTYLSSVRGGIWILISYPSGLQQVIISAINSIVFSYFRIKFATKI